MCVCVSLSLSTHVCVCALVCVHCLFMAVSSSHMCGLFRFEFSLSWPSEYTHARASLRAHSRRAWLFYEQPRRIKESTGSTCALRSSGSVCHMQELCLSFPLLSVTGMKRKNSQLLYPAVLNTHASARMRESAHTHTHTHSDTLMLCLSVSLLLLL